MKKQRKYIILLIVFALIGATTVWARQRVVRHVSSYLKTVYPELRFKVQHVHPTLLPFGADVSVDDLDSGVNFTTAVRYIPQDRETMQDLMPQTDDPTEQQILKDLQKEALRIGNAEAVCSDNYQARLAKTIVTVEVRPLLEQPEWKQWVEEWEVKVVGEDPTVPSSPDAKARLHVRWIPEVEDEEAFVERTLKFQTEVEALQIEELSSCHYATQAFPLDPEAFERNGAVAHTWLEIETKAPETPRTMPTTVVDPQDMSPEDWDALVATEETTAEIVRIASDYEAEWYCYEITLNRDFAPFNAADIKNGLRLREMTTREKRLFEQELSDTAFAN